MFLDLEVVTNDSIGQARIDFMYNQSQFGYRTINFNRNVHLYNNGTICEKKHKVRGRCKHGFTLHSVVDNNFDDLCICHVSSVI